MQKKPDHTPTVTPQPSTPVPVILPAGIPLQKTPSPLRVDEQATVVSDQLPETEATPEPPSPSKTPPDDEPEPEGEETADDEPVQPTSNDPPVPTIKEIPPSEEQNGHTVTQVGQ